MFFQWRAELQLMVRLRMRQISRRLFCGTPFAALPDKVASKTHLTQGLRLAAPKEVFCSAS